MMTRQTVRRCVALVAAIFLGTLCLSAAGEGD
jgi:hypothetical protein